MIKQKIIFLGLVVCFLSFGIGAASDPVPFEEKEYNLPVVEEIDLLVDGSITPILINLTKEFDYIMTVSIVLDWKENIIDFDDYGDIDVLVNGTEVLYDYIPISDPFNSLVDYFNIAAEHFLLRDDINPKNNHFKIFININDYIHPTGIKIREGHMLSVRINDDLTLAGEKHLVRFSGYRLIDKGYEFRRPFLEEVFLIDNPVELLMIPIIFPLACIFTAEPIYVIFGVAIFIVEILLFRMLWVHWRYR